MLQPMKKKQPAKKETAKAKLERLAAMNRARVQRFRDRKRATKSTKSSVPKNNRSIASESGHK